MENKNKNFSILTNSVALGGLTIVSNEILKISGNQFMSDGMAYLTGGACVVGGIILNNMFNDGKMGKLFRMCGIENKDNQIPIVIKKTKEDNKTTYVIHLPNGIAQHHFEQKLQELQQGLNAARIEFAWNKNLIMTVIEKPLGSMYEYIFTECKKPLEVLCGEGHNGPFILDIEKAPHCIIAGETGGGKSSLLDSIVISLILSKHDVHLRLIDFQAVTLGKYEDCKKVKSYGEKPEDLEVILDEMKVESERRKKLYRSVKNKVYIDKLSVWNELFPERYMPPVVVLVDEFARLKTKDCEPILEKYHIRVGEDRKYGIHYLASILRPSVDVIEGSMKANMPTRIAFRTATEVDSRVILDQEGAEKLEQEGRFLIKHCGRLHEVQALYMDPKKLMKFLKQHNSYKSRDEIQLERRENMKKLREKCINPYLKKDVGLNVNET